MSLQTVTAYPPHGKQIEVNNRYRGQNYSPWDFAVAAFQGQCDQQVGTYLLKVRKVVTRNNIPTITTGVNDTLFMSINGTQQSVTIQQGVYNATTLATTLNAWLTSIGAGTCNFSYDPNSLKYTFNAGGGIPCYFVSPITPIQDPNQPYTFPASYDRFLNMIGFYPNIGTNIPGGTSLLAGNTVRLSGTVGIYVNMTQSLDILTNMEGAPNHLIFVPFDDVAPGGTVTYDPSDPPTYAITMQNLQQMHLYVTDEWGQKPVVDSDTPLVIHFVLLPLTA